MQQQINVTISDVVLIGMHSTSILISSITAILLIFKARQDLNAAFILGFTLLLSALAVLNDLIVQTNIAGNQPFLYFLPIYFTLSIPLLYYIFVCIQSSNQTRLKIWHYILPSIQAVTYLSIGFLPTELKKQLWNDQFFRFYLTLESILFPILLFGYTLAVLKKLKAFHTAHEWSRDLKKWLIQFTNGIVIFTVIEILYILIEIASNLYEWYYPGLSVVHSFVIVLLLLWLSFNGLKFYFSKTIYKKRNENLDASQLSNLQSIYASVRTLMENEKLYLNPSLDLGIIAHMLGTTKESISAAINTKEKNFNTFLNTYRIEHFLALVKKDKLNKWTISSLAYESGFSSVSTFNRVFKQIQGNTPSAHIKQMNNNK